MSGEPRFPAEFIPSMRKSWTKLLQKSPALRKEAQKQSTHELIFQHGFAAGFLAAKEKPNE